MFATQEQIDELNYYLKDIVVVDSDDGCEFFAIAVEIGRLSQRIKLLPEPARGILANVMRNAGEAGITRS